MTDFRDLVNRAWMHAKIGPLYLAGYDPYGEGPLLSDEPTAYTASFVDRAEAVHGCVFERILLSERDQLEHEFSAVKAAYQRVEAKNYWTDDDRRHWSALGLRHADLRKAIQAYDAIEAEEAQEAEFMAGQLGAGA